MDVGWAIFLTGLVLVIPTIISGILWYNDYGYGPVSGWSFITVGLSVTIVILWIIAIWMGVKQQY